MPLGIDFTQIFLHLFNVLILFGGLYYILYSPVKKFMEKREEHYRQIDEEKNTALEEAQKLKEECDQRLQNSASEILEQKQLAAHELQGLYYHKMEEAEEEAKLIISKAEKEALRHRDEIIAGAKEELSGLIDDAADKLLLDGDTESFYDAFLDQAERGGADE